LKRGKIERRYYGFSVCHGNTARSRWRLSVDELSPHHSHFCRLLLPVDSTSAEESQGPSSSFDEPESRGSSLNDGGIYGRVTGLRDDVLTLEISDKVRVKVSRGHIAGVVKTDVMKTD
jgi:hypothetical protein